MLDIFILDLRIKLTLQWLTIPSVIPNAHDRVDSFILDLRIINMKSRSVMKSIQNNGIAWNVLRHLNASILLVYLS